MRILFHSCEEKLSSENAARHSKMDRFPFASKSWRRSYECTTRHQPTQINQSLLCANGPTHREPVLRATSESTCQCFSRWFVAEARQTRQTRYFDKRLVKTLRSRACDPTTQQCREERTTPRSRSRSLHRLGVGLQVGEFKRHKKASLGLNQTTNPQIKFAFVLLLAKSYLFFPPEKNDFRTDCLCHDRMTPNPNPTSHLRR